MKKIIFTVTDETAHLIKWEMDHNPGPFICDRLGDTFPTKDVEIVDADEVDTSI